MAKKLYGRAAHYIPFGSPVLHRGYEFRKASPDLANATADRPEYRTTKRGYSKGEKMTAEPVDGLGQRTLSAMANGPCMDPLRIYLPEGKLTEAQYQERLKLDFKRAGIDD